MLITSEKLYYIPWLFTTIHLISLVPDKDLQEAVYIWRQPCWKTIEPFFGRWWTLFHRLKKVAMDPAFDDDVISGFLLFT